MLTWLGCRGAWRSLIGAMVVVNLHPSTAAGQGGRHEFREVHLGMEMRLVVHGDGERSARAARTAFERVEALEAILSDWRLGSEVSRIAAAPVGEWFPVSKPLVEVLGRAMAVAEATDGRFDPTIGPLTTLWREERTTGVRTSDSALAVARARVGWQAVEVDTVAGRIRLARPAIQLDLGGVAKGYILAEAIAVLRARGFPSALAEAGGDLVLGDAPPGAAGWVVAVGDTSVVAHNVAIATSGPSKQSLPTESGDRESHVIDIRTGRGSRADAEFTVIGRDAAITDAVATALTLVEPHRRQALLERFELRLVRR